MNQNETEQVSLGMALLFFAAIFFLGLTGCSTDSGKDSIKMSEPEIFIASRQEYVKLTSVPQKMRDNQSLMLTAADKLVFAPGDSAKGLRITTSCILSTRNDRPFTFEPFTWNRSFRSEIPFLEMLPISVIQKELRGEIPADASVTCGFSITALGDGGSTHKMDIPMVAFDVKNVPNELNSQNSLSESLAKSNSSRAHVVADKIQVTFICSSGVADELVSSGANITSDRSTQILADQQSASRISWFKAQQNCRIGFLDGERILTAVSNPFVVQVPRLSVSVSFIHNRDYFYEGQANTFKLGTIVIRNLTQSPIVASGPQIAAGLFRYAVLRGSMQDSSSSVSGGGLNPHTYYTDEGSVRLVPQLSADHINPDGSIDVFIGQNGTGSIDVYGINPQLFCGAYAGNNTVDALFVAHLRPISESPLAIHAAEILPQSGYSRGAKIHNLATETSAYSVLVRNEFRDARNHRQYMDNPEFLMENPRRPLSPARCLNGLPIN